MYMGPGGRLVSGMQAKKIRRSSRWPIIKWWVEFDKRHRDGATGTCEWQQMRGIDQSMQRDVRRWHSSGCEVRGARCGTQLALCVFKLVQ
jgi:hypothetical protein